MQDPYEILGVKKESSEKEIKSAYRKQALKWHPDKHKGEKDAEAKFKEINQAYEILSDKNKRQQFDNFGAAGAQGGFNNGGGFNGGGGFGGFDFSGFSGGEGGGFADIFETFFGGGGRGSRSSKGKKNSAVRGNDIEATISITFEDAVFGCEKELEISKYVECSNCEGKGAEPGSAIISCKHCHGTGEIRMVKNTILGQISTSHVCEVCMGEGKIPEKKCTVCSGTCRMRVKERVKVKIPAGIDNGSTVRINGKGEGGLRGGPNGDLYINLSVSPSKKFLRYGLDIHTELEIPVVQAVMGAEVEVDTLYGPEKIKIPAATQDGKVFKLSDKGVTAIGNAAKKGDQLIKIRIRIPEKLSKREKELYQELANESGIEISKGGWF
ncbi:MAG: molecular chaperone DnaJ [Patescibacteria group bacterium]